VLDPFMGSGSTAIAAVRTDRHYVGFDTDPDYVALAERRVDAERAATGGGHRVTVAPRRSRDQAGDGDDAGLGSKARDIARRALVDAGFSDLEEGPTLTDLGVGLDFRARDARGGTWLFLLSGAYSATRPGLRRADVAWRALGVAAVIRESRSVDPGRVDLGPLVLLSTDLPLPRSAIGRALDAVTSADGPVRDVCELLDPGDMGRLAGLAAGTDR
jgi:site-specific DNA-methyltransferase (adenine-specific)